jgi:predicted nucleic acid-binding protein
MRGQPLTNQQAWAVYDGFLSDDRVRVFHDLPWLDDQFRAFSSVSQSSPKVWVDAYLAANAAANEAVLVTFDQALTRYGIECRILT